MAIDLFTEYSKDIDLNQLNADFSIAEPNKFKKWTYQEGTVTEQQGSPGWTGTYIDEISEQIDPKTGKKYFGYGRSTFISIKETEANSPSNNPQMHKQQFYTPSFKNLLSRNARQ